MVDQMAVEYVKNEYEAVGMDLDSIQMRYIMTAGLKMLGFSLLIVAAAILISLFASRVAAKFGENLRLAVFRQVVSFSGSEFNTFSTASLITRCTNDIQQIQMLVVMLLRMVLYAPILGIGAPAENRRVGDDVGHRTGGPVYRVHHYFPADLCDAEVQ